VTVPLQVIVVFDGPAPVASGRHCCAAASEDGQTNPMAMAAASAPTATALDK
jgi:hypothetical protein